MENGGQQPPFSPIGIKQSQGANPPTNISEPERFTPNSSASVPPRSVLQLWKDVAHVYDTQKQVLWRSAVDSLAEAHRYIYSESAKSFIESYMKHIVGILLDQNPSKLGPMEKNCVEESLNAAMVIVFDDMKNKIDPKAGECAVLDVLSLIFNRKKNYYKAMKNNWSGDNGGLPEVRSQLVFKFRNLDGFKVLGLYLSARIGLPDFPPLEIIHHLLPAAADSMNQQTSGSDRRSFDEGLTLFGRSVMEYIYTCSEDTLKKQSHESLSAIIFEIQKVYERFAATRREDFYSFFDFLRKLTLKLITSQSLPLRLYGWETVKDLVEVSSDYRPPPRAYRVFGAGCDYANGIYEYASQKTDEGYAKPGADIKYELRPTITESTSDGSAKHKNLTLFRCTMRSQQKWWFLSEADEVQPGTDKDIDYYQHKSRKHEEATPPCNGWNTCNKSNGSQGIDPPPTLEPIGLVTPAGEEFNTLEHQLAKWAIENNVVEIMLGDSIHREIVARSVPFIRFLAFMCSRDDMLGDSFRSDPRHNSYGLKSSQLKLAWKICTSKLDAAVSTEVLQMLVCILPNLPAELAILFLNDVQQSLTHSILVVAEFCSSLASLCNSERERQNNPNSVPLPSFTDAVRLEMLKLLWSILNHPDGLSLKCYGIIKDFVSTELQIEPLGTVERVSLLRQCQESLLIFSSNQDESVDELRVIRSVNLTLFVLEACPLEQSVEILSADGGAFPMIIFSELIAYLNRIAMSSYSGTYQGINSDTILADRLFILRYVYGVSEELNLTANQLDTLWELCVKTDKIETFLVFLAHASVNNSSPNEQLRNNWDDVLLRLPQWNSSISVASRVRLKASYSKEVKDFVFQQYFCSSKVNWESLGVKAYQSFSFLHSLHCHAIDHSSLPYPLDGPAIDALWRICLESADDAVASQAMTDLLGLYINMNAINPSRELVDDSMNRRLESFAHRIYDVLNHVYLGLLTGNNCPFRSAERCCKILLTAVLHDQKDDRFPSAYMTPDFSSVSPHLTHIYLDSIPHGFRGQTCYRTISILARRTQNQVPMHLESSSGSLPSSQRFSMQIHPLETLGSIKKKIAKHCQHDVSLVRPLSFNGRRATVPEQSQVNLNIEPDDSTASSLGIANGSEIVVLLAHPPLSENHVVSESILSGKQDRVGLLDYIVGSQSKDPNKFYDLLLKTVHAIVETQDQDHASISHLFWELLSAIPTNALIVEKVRLAANRSSSYLSTLSDAMIVDSVTKEAEWRALLDTNNIQKSIYTLQIIDSFLNPALEIIEHAPVERRSDIVADVLSDSAMFRKGFIETGGLDLVINFFNGFCSATVFSLKIGHLYMLRILKSALTGSVEAQIFEKDSPSMFKKTDNIGHALMKSMTNPILLVKTIVHSITRDASVPESAIADALLLTRVILEESDDTVDKFANLEQSVAEKFITMSLLWKSHSASISSLCSEQRIRKDAASFILEFTPLLPYALQWIVGALESLEVSSESCSELFSVLIQVVEKRLEVSREFGLIERLCSVVCAKLVSYPRRFTDDFSLEYSTQVLCGCLRLLQALVQFTEEGPLGKGISLLYDSLKGAGYFQEEIILNSRHKILLNLISVIFERFFEGDESRSLTALCNDKDSRRFAFGIILAAAEACIDGEGFMFLSRRINGLINTASPSLLHRWGMPLGASGPFPSQTASRSKYSGLRNQGCTCYMNSVLQQLFMMPRLQKKLCSATLPSLLRSSKSHNHARGRDLVGMRILLPWENGHSYEAIVQDFDEMSGCHIIRYLILNASPDIRFTVPEALPEEFNLLEGRPGKEVGTFELSHSLNENQGEVEIIGKDINTNRVEENIDEIASRRLLEEIQRTFVHLEVGSRGRCFDPRAFVEACTCLKLEFDVWQQNDASEFAMKLLDRLEPALKRWSPSVFKYVENTFRIKQTKQKICKECGMKTNREESFMSIDCQIRGKTDIDEALASMCEVEYMEGDNKVYCDQCKKKCDTILRTAISALPDVLILSLKRFDLDYNTFETVKLNSRCAFGQTLNVKKYTLDVGDESTNNIADISLTDANMDIESTQSTPLSDQDYEYSLVGVLVHAGVAQGGHYYSLIKDRSTGSNDEGARWFKFDDEDVTAFDPSNIELECFGGKVKKETKWPNGQVQVVESEQFANALMLFYEKSKPVRVDTLEDNDCRMEDCEIEKYGSGLISGYDAFVREVRRSNTTHSQHSFMFDQEFQNFLRGVLDVLCRSLDTPTKEVNELYEPRSWQGSSLNTCISYYFDVLLHSRESATLEDWTNKLAIVLSMDKAGSRSFIHDLSDRCMTVRRNWIRIFLADCSDDASRSSAVKIFTTAFQSCLSIPDERLQLVRWNENLSQLLKDWNMELFDRRFPPKPILSFNDILLRMDHRSAIGVIVIYCAQLLDFAPQIWRNTYELFEFIRDISSTDEFGDDYCLLSAVIKSHVPSRFVCLILRNLSPQYLKAIFPMASMSPEMVRNLVKSEGNPRSSTCQQTSTDIVMNHTESNSTHEVSILFEALAAVLDMKAMRCIPLVYETGEVFKGKRLVNLTEPCIKALAVVYNEWTDHNGLMSHRLLIDYLNHCEIFEVQSHQLLSILHKYGKAQEGLDGNWISLDGFIAYYRDIAQNDPDRLLHDLCCCGFRPNLTRRSENCMSYNRGGRAYNYEYTESVAHDVAEMMSKCTCPPIDHLTSTALLNFHIFSSAFIFSHHLATYLIARCCYNVDTTALITETLRNLYKALPSWNGNDLSTTCLRIIATLTAIPDKYQNERISAIMNCSDRVQAQSDTGCGLLTMAKALYLSRQNHSPYSIEYRDYTNLLERYIEVLKELQKQNAVSHWISDVGGKFNNLMDILLSSKTNRPMVTSDVIGRKEEVADTMQPLFMVETSRQYDVNSDSLDSDGNAELNYSDEDNDSRYDPEGRPHSFDMVTVVGAGCDSVNGVYNLHGSNDGVKKFRRYCRVNDQEQIFSLYRCKLNDGSRRWYISIVPEHIEAGTNKDIDYYFAQATGSEAELPPNDHWRLVSQGRDPPPKLTYTSDEAMVRVDPTRPSDYC